MKTRSISNCLLAIGLIVLFAGRAHGVTVEFQEGIDGYTSTQDTHIYEYLPAIDNGSAVAAITGQPTPFTIQALEDCSIIESDRRSFEHVASQHLQASRLQSQLIADAFVRNENREALLLTRDAAGRYQWLLENEADLLARIPQFHIASYLGVDAVSLSRIRRKFKTHSHNAMQEE